MEEQLSPPNLENILVAGDNFGAQVCTSAMYVAYVYLCILFPVLEGECWTEYAIYYNLPPIPHY